MPPFVGPTQANNFSDIQIWNALFPKEGPKTVPVALNFNTQTSYSVDLTLVQQRGYMSIFQTVYIDNSLSVQPVTIICSVSNQKITCPGLSQGTFPLFVPGNAIFTISSSGGQVVVLFFTNMPLPFCVWSATQTFSFNASGYLQVSDPVLDATVVGNSVTTTPNLTENNNVIKPAFGADEVFTGNTTTTTPVTLTTGAPSFFIADIFVAATNDISVTGGGDLEVTIKDGATIIFQGWSFAPAASATTGAGTIPLIVSRGLQYNSKASTQALTLTLGTVLASGKVYWNVAGGLCSNIGP